MFSFNKTKSYNFENNSDSNEICKPISFKLGDQNLVFTKEGIWVNEKNELDVLNEKIEDLVSDNDSLTEQIEALTNHVKHIQNECENAYKLKTVTMDMLKIEREQNVLHKKEIEGYQDELKKCYKIIIELR